MRYDRLYPNGCTVGELIGTLQDLIEANEITENTRLFIQYDNTCRPAVVHHMGYDTYRKHLIIMEV